MAIVVRTLLLIKSTKVLTTNNRKFDRRGRSRKQLLKVPGCSTIGKGSESLHNCLNAHSALWLSHSDIIDEAMRFASILTKSQVNSRYLLRIGWRGDGFTGWQPREGSDSWKAKIITVWHLKGGMWVLIKDQISRSPQKLKWYLACGWGLLPLPVARYHFDIRLKFSIPPGEFESPSHPWKGCVLGL